MSQDTQDQNQQRTVQDFFDRELCGYAKYTIENRAIPSVIDGFKPSQRKIAHTANGIWKTGNERPMKVFQLGGEAASKTLFHHGSLDGTIIGMTQEFKNSMPIFQGIGQFGSLRAPEAGAPRYVGVKFNENFRLLYKDFDLVTPQHEEGEEIEPKFFLPIIPTVLLNGGSGIAVGFATNILNRNPVDLIDACKLVIEGKECPVVRPWIKGFTGDFKRVQDAPRSWTIHGKFEVKNTTTVLVTEIPPSWTYEKYESHLDSLEEKGVITSYEDHSAESPNYIVKFTRQKLAELIEKDKLDEVLKMQEREGENYVALDENGNLKIFESPEEIVKYFVSFRLKYYEIRRSRLLEKLAADLRSIISKCKFIKGIVDQKIIVNNKKKEEIEQLLALLKFDKENDSYDYLLRMPIHSLTKERFDELIQQAKQKEEESKKIEATTPKEMYLSDLKELRKKVS
jgi:DNA topoisomerase-2